MKPLSRLESLIAEIVERPAWGLSQRRVHPLELTTALVKVMESRAVRLADRILAPDAYELRLNSADLAGFADAVPVLERELGQYLLRTFDERDLSCNLPPSVRIVGDGGVRPGKIDVNARFSSPAEPAGTTVAARTSILRNGTPSTPVPRAAPSRADGPPALELIGPDGAIVRTFRLDRPLTVIGRRSSTDIPLLDVGVSREHARVERAGAGFVVADLGSTNGTFLNDKPVQARQPLRDGDIVGVGRYQLRFRLRS